jgi:nucleotidyltransferase/DNA polymerase involved in DNA repair
MLVCLLIDYLRVEAEIHRNPSLAGRPVVIVRSFGSQRVVMDASVQAPGVEPGMPLAEALDDCSSPVLPEAIGGAAPHRRACKGGRTAA